MQNGSGYATNAMFLVQYFYVLRIRKCISPAVNFVLISSCIIYIYHLSRSSSFVTIGHMCAIMFTTPLFLLTAAAWSSRCIWWWFWINCHFSNSVGCTSRTLAILWSNTILNFGSHSQKSQFHISCLFCRRFQEWYFQMIGIFLCRHTKLLCIFVLIWRINIMKYIM